VDAEGRQRAIAGIDLSRIDLTRPSAARVYDYCLGGFHNFPVDRELAEAAIAVRPTVRANARAGRSFLGRAVTHLAADLGIRQFLDLGSGIPTAGNVHEIAQAVDPSARVVYVDLEPVAVSHAEMILAGDPNTASVLADLRNPEQVLESPAVRRLLDPGQPTALLLSLVLHFVPDDDDPAALVRTYREALGPGSWLAISHGTHEFEPETALAATRLYQRTAIPTQPRTRSEVLALLDGYEFVAPGVVLAEQWQPGAVREVEAPERYPIWVGVAQARG
jgi:SAM-dependent methyltransferase